MVSGDLYFLFFPDGTYGETIITVVEGHIFIIGIEMHGPSAVRSWRIERRRPVAAIGTRNKETRNMPVSRAGEEDTIAVIGGYQSAVYAILRCRYTLALV